MNIVHDVDFSSLPLGVYRSPKGNLIILRKDGFECFDEVVFFSEMTFMLKLDFAVKISECKYEGEL